MFSSRTTCPMTIKVFSVAEMVAAEKAADAAGHSMPK